MKNFRWWILGLIFNALAVNLIVIPAKQHYEKQIGELILAHHRTLILTNRLKQIHDPVTPLTFRSLPIQNSSIGNRVATIKIPISQTQISKFITWTSQTPLILQHASIDVGADLVTLSWWTP